MFSHNCDTVQEFVATRTDIRVWLRTRCTLSVSGAFCIKQYTACLEIKLISIVRLYDNNVGFDHDQYLLLSIMMLNYN